MHKKLLCSNECELWGLIPVREVLRCLPLTLTICGLKDERGRHPKERLREPFKLKSDLFKGFVISSVLCPCSLFSVKGHVWEQKVTLPNIWLCLTEHTIAFPISVLCVCPRGFNPLAEAKYSLQSYGHHGGFFCPVCFTHRSLKAKWIIVAFLLDRLLRG